MANKRKRDHSKDAKRVAQRGRTHKNLKAKYEALLSEFPGHKDAAKWKASVAAL